MKQIYKINVYLLYKIKYVNKIYFYKHINVTNIRIANIHRAFS